MHVLLIGLILVVFCAIFGPYAYYILRDVLWFCSYLPIGLVFLFMVVVAGLNVVLKIIRRRWGLSSRELFLIYSMIMVGGQPVSYGMTSYLLSIMSAPYYFATPENRRAECSASSTARASALERPSFRIFDPFDEEDGLGLLPAR